MNISAMASERLGPYPTFPSIQSPEELREHILRKSPLKREENEKIFDVCFSGHRHRDRLFHYLDRKLHFTQATVADVGCGYGQHLVHCGNGSYGLEYEPYYVNFLSAIGLPVRKKNIITDDLSDLPRVDTVWCAATLEHVDSPHVFLRRLHYILQPNGRLIIEVPCALPAPWMRHIPGANYIYGDHGDHVNSFSPTSLFRFCERAGFKAEWIFRYSTPLINRWRGEVMPVWLTRIPPFRLVANAIVYVGRQIPDWEYPRKSTRTAVNNLRGYEFRGWFSDNATDLADR